MEVTMKTSKMLLLVFILITAAAVSSFAQQEFTFTTSPANASGPRALIDMPGLSGNPLAIIVATPLGDTEMLNQHPIGVWYIGGKWYLVNVDIGVIPPGAKYRIQFFQRPGPDHFLHNVTRQNVGAEGSYIDSPVLNNNPNAQVKILNNASDVRSPNGLNQHPVTAGYSSAAGRWYITNTDGQPLYIGSAFNVVVGSGTAGPVTPVPSPVNPGPSPVNPGPSPTNPNTGNTTTPPPIRGPVDKTDRPPASPSPIPTPTPLKGWVDMHTHPMSHLGFGKKVMYGAPDIGSIVPAGTRNCNPQDFRATTINEALGNCSSTHGGWGIDNTCGDYMRAFVLNNQNEKDIVYMTRDNVHGDHLHQGLDFFPHQSSKVHQQMWWEWIKRAKEEGNLRVMVALAVNSEILAELINGDSPKDDKGSADLQIDEIKSFVGRHSDFMEIAYTPADLRRIVGGNKLAVILGMEVDNIGDFNRLPVDEQKVKTEIQRLYEKGVRYIFPIHLVNNKFGGTAVYEDLFNFSNKYLTRSYYKVETGSVEYRLGLTGKGGALDFGLIQTIKVTMGALAPTPYPPAFNGDPTSPNFCPAPVLGCWKTYRLVKSLLTPEPDYLLYSTIPGGHVNQFGLTNLGNAAVKEMMRLGMLIDIDHMSDKSQDDTLKLAKDFDYPVNIGHNGVQNSRKSERIASIANVKRVAQLGGLFGVGTTDSEEHHTDSPAFIHSFNEVWLTLSSDGGQPRVAIGSDVNGMERLPKAPTGVDSDTFYKDFPRSMTGNKAWDYTREGVAHYGLMADFMKDVKEKNATVHGRLMDSAEYFAQMWEKVERQKLTVK